VEGDAIISGYGFMGENDFICILNRHTGHTTERIPVETAPEFLYIAGDRLHVCCHGTDLVYSIRQGAGSGGRLGFI